MKSSNLILPAYVLVDNAGTSPVVLDDGLFNIFCHKDDAIALGIAIAGGGPELRILTCTSSLLLLLLSQFARAIGAKAVEVRNSPIPDGTVPEIYGLDDFQEEIRRQIDRENEAGQN